MDRKETIRITGYLDRSGIRNYFVDHLKKYTLLKEVYIGKCSKAEDIKIFFDFICSVIFLGAGINDYFQYHFFDRSYKERKEFITGRKWKRMIKICNGCIHIDVFDNKCRFNQVYAVFLGREWLDFATCSFEEFESFCKRNKSFFLKKYPGEWRKWNSKD